MLLFTQAMLYRLLLVFVVIGTVAAMVPLPDLMTNSTGQAVSLKQALVIGFKAKLK